MLPRRWPRWYAPNWHKEQGRRMGRRSEFINHLDFPCRVVYTAMCIRGVAQPRLAHRVGTRGSEVQILSPRLKKIPEHSLWYLFQLYRKLNVQNSAAVLRAVQFYRTAQITLAPTEKLTKAYAFAYFFTNLCVEGRRPETEKCW